MILRPMTEADWDLLMKWNSDPEVLYFSEGDNVTGRTLEEVHNIYRSVSQAAFCFIAEYDGRSIGECWLQQMNLERILKSYPDLDCRRIDLTIGEKDLWGHGIGTRVVGLLSELGFEEEQSDVIFACDVADYNPRSLKAFQKNGYEVDSVVPQPPGRKARSCYDLILTREKFEKVKSGQRIAPSRPYRE